MKDDQISVYDFYFVELEKIMAYLNPSLGNDNNLFDKRIATFHVFRSIAKNLKFIRTNYNESPFSAFATLSRMIVDNYSAFFLISSFSNNDEQKLRYYLYMIGSLEGRIKTMSDFENSLKNLSKEISQGNQKAIERDQKAVQNFINKIKLEKLANITEEKHIKKRNWKFPNEVPAENKTFYTWQELYKIAKIPSNFSKAIQQHFSEFTHGLGLTILYTEEKLDSKQSILAILSIIQSLIGKIILEEFQEELKDLTLDENFIYNCNYNWQHWR